MDLFPLISDLGNSPRPSPSIDSDIEKVNHILKREGHPESKYPRGGSDNRPPPTHQHSYSNHSTSDRDPPYREYRERQDFSHHPRNQNPQAFRDQKSRQQYNRNRNEYPGDRDNMYPTNMNQSQYRQPYQQSSYQQQNMMGAGSMGGGYGGGQQGNYQMQRQAGGNFPMNQQRQAQPNAYGNQNMQPQTGYGMQQQGQRHTVLCRT